MTTKIEWATDTLNTVVGCSRVSAGCDNCYAIGQAHVHYAGAGLTTRRAGRIDWSGELRFFPERLAALFRWRTPRRVFLDSMSDLFHPKVPDSHIDTVLAGMALAQQHTGIILTKRAERMREYASAADRAERVACAMATFATINGRPCPMPEHVPEHLRPPWPLPNVRLGVSVEDQATADERVPELLATPAACRVVSAEPLLGPIDFAPFVDADYPCPACKEISCDHQTVDQVIVGGESGPGARPCRIEWIRSIVEQCRNSSTAAFVKQVGARPVEEGCAPGHVFVGRNPSSLHRLRDRKGGDPSEWPEDLRVREEPDHDS